MSFEARYSIPEYPFYRSEPDFNSWFFNRFDTLPGKEDVDRWKIAVEQQLRCALELPLLQLGLPLPAKVNLFKRN